MSNNGKKETKKRRWLRLTNLLAAATGAAAVGIAAKRLSRPRDVRWLDHAHILHHAMTSNFRVVDGVRIHYQEMTGIRSSEAMILLHGFCSSNYTWKDCMTPFADAGYRVIAPDLKGYGFSEKPADRRYDVNDQATLVISLMDSLGIQRATIVGNSFGGAVAMACALNHPARVDRLVLIDAAHNNNALKRAPRFGQQLVNAVGLAEIFGPMLFGSSRFIHYYMSNMFYDKSVMTAERFEAYHRPLRTATCQAAAISTLRQWQLDWIERELSSIDLSTLIIWGEHDWALPVEWGAQIHLAMPKSKFIVIPDCGHLPQEERPEDTCALILDFCAHYRQSSQQSANVRHIKR
jgi:pimeloyl-ACP methyl ester carboxylesterase